VSKVDLHVHTTASDGQYAPAEVVRLALQRGMRVLAITDHDTVAGVSEALDAARACGTVLEVIPGVEISAEARYGEVHILGYYVDIEEPGFLALLDRLRDARRARAQRIVDRLAELGFHVPWQRVADLAGDGAYGRPHIAQVMVEQGHVLSTHEAFERYLGPQGPAYVARYKLTPAEAVHAIAQVGGVPVLAHPWGIENLEDVVADLVAEGLAGIEAYYHGYTPEMMQELVNLARKHGLIVTGGSDFHGAQVVAGVELGSVDAPLWVVEEMRTRSRLLVTSF
jgi:predicted metal-dependent phosphoesterase TrpH